MSNKLLKHVTKKTLKFSIAGALGACIGQIATEIFRSHTNVSFFDNVVDVALWAGTIGLGISLALLIVQNVYLKKFPFSKSMIKTAIIGIFLGAIAGGIAQVAFALTYDISRLAEITSRIICWGIFGLGVGWGVSLFVPNYPKKRAMMAGLLGGIVGGAAFRISFEIFPETYGRLVGVAILGLFIGFVISYIEEILREAWLTVVWGKNETTSVSLGNKPIILGSSPQADIYLPVEKNYPPITAIINIENSKVIIDNRVNNQRTELRNGSKVTMGALEVIVNVKTSKS
jgi:Ca-activated chloride channel family protein